MKSMNIQGRRGVESKQLQTRVLLLVTLMIVLLCLPVIKVSIMAFVLNLLIATLMYVCLAESWNLLGGMIGLFSIGHSAFFGLGIYSVIIAVVRFQINIWLGICIGIILSILLAVLIGRISSTLKDMFFAMATLAMAQVLRSLSMQWLSLTRGPMGMSLPLSYMIPRTVLYYLALGLALMSVVLVALIRKSRMGTMFVTIRENEDLARSLGINAPVWKIFASIISAVMAAGVGSFYAIYINTVVPDAAFSMDTSLKMIIVTVIGGKGTVLGPVLGASIIIVDELIRGWLGGTYAGLSTMVYGSILTLTILLLPNGLIRLGHRTLHADPGNTRARM